MTQVPAFARRPSSVRTALLAVAVGSVAAVAPGVAGAARARDRVQLVVLAYQSGIAVAR